MKRALALLFIYWNFLPMDLWTNYRIVCLKNNKIYKRIESKTAML
jgi:hypothetical protein